MGGIGRRGAVVLGAVLLAVVVPAAAGAAGRSYGPSWGRFEASFPSAPVAAVVPSAELSGLTGALAARSYAVSTVPISSASALSAPTYEVVVVRFHTAAQATKVVKEASKDYPHMAKVSAGGASGVEHTGVAAATAESKAFSFGVLFASRGAEAFEVVVATATASPVPRFLRSFRPVG